MFLIFINLVNSARKTNKGEHNGSLVMNYENIIEKATEQLSKGFAHNKSSNLAFGAGEKGELLEGDKSSEKAQISQKKTKAKSKLKKIHKEPKREKSPSENT